MTMEVFTNLNKLLVRADALLNGVDVITLDLFDTLLVRRTHDPDLVKIPTAKYISALAEQQGIKISYQQVQRVRDEAEKQNRATTAQQHVDHEAHYPTFMADALKQIFADLYDDDLLNKISDFEIQMENAFLVPRQAFVQWLQRVQGQGKRIIVLSDMYLPKAHLEKLTAHAGLDGLVDEVISSADSFKAKASGLAYPLLAERLNLQYSRWLHVGDNVVSDGAQASAHGIKSLLIRDVKEHQRRGIAARHHFFSRARAFWTGRHLQQLMAPLEAENDDHDERYIEGYNYFSPQLCFYIQRLAERCLQQDIQHIYFLSREGWLLKQLWEHIVPVLFAGKKLPEVSYLYVSRIALAAASCGENGLTEDNVSMAFLPDGNRNFLDVCRIFGLDPEPLRDDLQRYKLTTETVLSGHHDGYHPVHSMRLAELLADAEFQNKIREQAGHASAGLQAYLSHEGFFDKQRVALVDIGWLGTIQRFFHQAISHHSTIPDCHGMLFACTRGVQFAEQANSRIEGLVYDRQNFNLAASSILFARDIYEEACRAPHPTLMAYRESAAAPGYELVFRDMDDAKAQAEKRQDEHYASLQQGIIDGAKRYGAAAAVAMDHSDEAKPWINFLMQSKLAFPLARDVSRLRLSGHLDDFQGAAIPKRRRLRGWLRNFAFPWQHSGIKLVISCCFTRLWFAMHRRARLNRE